MFQTRWFHNLMIGVLVLAILGVLFLAWSSGSKAAKSKTILKDTKAMAQGIDYFYKDQNRYPTTGEFKDNNLMRAYISNYPPQIFLSKTCEATYDYYSSAPNTFELRFCLPKGQDGYRTGWNVYKK